jgi:CBS-domain-containing membrane protein
VEVSEVMHSPVVTISPGELLSEATKQMIDNRIGGLPVLDTNDQMAGIPTETDLLRALIDQLGKETPQVFWTLPRQPKLHRLTCLFKKRPGKGENEGR